MKKLILLLFVFSMALPSVGQIESGAVVVKGDLSFNKTKSDNVTGIDYEQTQTSFAFRPGAGIFVSESLLLGVGLSLDYAETETKASPLFDPFLQSSVRKTILFNPYMTHYTSIADKLYFNITVNALVGVGEEEYKFSDTGTDFENDVFEARLTVIPGLNYFLNERWNLVANFGSLYYLYRSAESRDNDSSANEVTSSSFGLSFSANTFGLGIQYFLRNKVSE